MPTGINKGEIYHGDTVTDIHDRSGMLLRWYKLVYDNQELYYLSHERYDVDIEVEFELVKSTIPQRDDFAVNVNPK